MHLSLETMVRRPGVDLTGCHDDEHAQHPEQAQRVREKFEGTWVATNMLRTLLCTAGLAALTRALFLHGRGSR